MVPFPGFTKEDPPGLRGSVYVQVAGPSYRMGAAAGWVWIADTVNKARRDAWAFLRIWTVDGILSS